MGKIQFGSEVYTWFMQGTGKGYDNKLDHMIKVASEAGFTGTSDGLKGKKNDGTQKKLHLTSCNFS